LIRIKAGYGENVIFPSQRKKDVASRYLIGLVVLFGLGGFLHANLRTEISASDRAPRAYYVTIFDSGSALEIMNTNYPSLFPSTFAPFGGRYIMHFGARRSFDGQPPEQVIVIRFNNMHDLLAWHSSEAFKKTYDPHRLGHLRAFAVEGVGDLPADPGAE
jgi:uncharacterized protein (DUF1330 family)